MVFYFDKCKNQVNYSNSSAEIFFILCTIDIQPISQLSQKSITMLSIKQMPTQ